MKPFGFHDYNHLQMKAFCAISDSGNIILTGLDETTILEAVEAVTDMYSPKDYPALMNEIPADYQICNTAERVVKLIIGTGRLSNAWDGIRRHDYV